METEAYARNTDPATSHQAASHVNTTELENLVLLALKPKGLNGATTAELEAELKVSRVSISPRMRPLANRNLIHDSGTRRRGIVWVYGPAPSPSPGNNMRIVKKVNNNKTSAALVAAVLKVKTLLESKRQLDFDELATLDQVNAALKEAGAI